MSPDVLPALMPQIDLTAVIVICAALLLGGLAKGATGAGAPVVAVPVMAAFFDVRLAVIIMVAPNFVTNIGQLRKYWPHRLGEGFTWKYAASGAVGAAIGTAFLAVMPERALLALVAAAVVSYIALRLARPDFRLSLAHARKGLVTAGLAGGVLQGAAGISAPISVSFLNAMRLERPRFIATISAFFAAMTVTQMPALAFAGLLTPQLLALSAAALVPILVAMPLGAWLAGRLSAAAFDKLTLGLLTLLALRLIYATLTPVSP